MLEMQKKARFSAGFLCIDSFYPMRDQPWSNLTSDCWLVFA